MKKTNFAVAGLSLCLLFSSCGTNQKTGTAVGAGSGAALGALVGGLLNNSHRGTGAYFLESIVSDVSIDSSKAKTFLSNYNNMKTTIQNQRLSVMGVDTDEEAMDLMKFQQAYNLNSKMMSVMNEIYDKLINQTGL